MNADFQLRHATVSRHGSFWGSQTDNATRDMLRELSRTSSAASRLQHIDAVGAYAVGARKILKEDIVIDFTDGHFLMAGPDLQAYVPTVDPLDADAFVGPYFRSNAAIGESGAIIRGHKLTDMTPGEITELTADVPTLARAGAWYLIPKPAHINPISLSTRKAGVNLAYGIDFFTSKHFIITQLSPAEYFASGAILINVAEVSLEAFDSYASDSPRSKKGRKWFNTYAKRSQSIELFRRAAAEFCGLYVLPEDDVVLNVVELPDGTRAYAFANAGVVTIDYTHTPLAVGSALRAGYVVCDVFQIQNKATTGSGFLGAVGIPIDLSGIYGVPAYLPAGGMVEFTYYYVSPTLKTHLRLYYAATQPDLDFIWVTQMGHELRTGMYLSDQLFLADPETFMDLIGFFPPTVDAGAMIEEFYGNRLHLLIVDGVPTSYKFELQRFLREHAPVGAVVLLADTAASAPPIPLVPVPPEGNIFYAGSHLHYETSTLSYA